MTATADRPAARRCPGCGTDLTGSYITRKWCSERCRKAQYGNDCRNCGRRTTGTNGGPAAPELCTACHNKARAKWTKERIVEALWAWRDQYGEPPVANDWLPAMARYRGRADAEQIQRRFDSGDWPSTNTVRLFFGSWNAAIEAAGFSPLRPGQRRSTRAVSFQTPKQNERSTQNG